MKIGFIGLGRMGFALSSHLLRKGEDVVVYDTRPEPVAEAVKLGASGATSPRELADGADLVFTMLPGPREVREVVLGSQGILSVLRPGSFLVELSTVDIETVDEVARSARERGIRFADAPVGRLAAHADRGESLFMLGAGNDDHSSIETVLLKMGTTVLHCGEAGMGTRMKLINNFMVLCYCQLNSEALVLANALGLDIRKVLDVLTGTTASNGQLKEKWPVKVLGGDLSPGFDITLGLKDLTLACQAAQSSGVSLPMGNLARNLFELAKCSGRAGQDTSCMTDFWAEVNAREPLRM